MIDDLRALVQRLRDPHRWHGYSMRNDAADAIESLLARAEAAEAECARLRQDAERLDWVERTNPIIFHKSFDGDQWEVVTDPNGNEGGQCAYTLRAAIDRAIAEGKHES